MKRQHQEALRKKDVIVIEEKIRGIQKKMNDDPVAERVLNRYSVIRLF